MSMLIKWFRGYGLKKSSLGFAVLRSIIYDSNFVTEPMGKFFRSCQLVVHIYTHFYSTHLLLE